MKKIQQLSVLILLFSFFAACTTEPIDPNLASQLAANNAANNNGGTNTSSQNGTFKVDIDGQTVNGTQIVANKTITNDPVLGQIVTYTVSASFINPSTNLPNTIGLQFQNVSLNTTYNLGNVDLTNGGRGFISYYPNSTIPTTVYNSNNLADMTNHTPSGQLIVTSNDTTNKIISGTFHGTVYLNDLQTFALVGTKNFTNGIFSNVHYTLQ